MSTCGPDSLGVVVLRRVHTLHRITSKPGLEVEVPIPARRNPHYVSVYPFINETYRLM